MAHNPGGWRGGENREIYRSNALFEADTKNIHPRSSHMYPHSLPYTHHRAIVKQTLGKARIPRQQFLSDSAATESIQGVCGERDLAQLQLTRLAHSKIQLFVNERVTIADTDVLFLHRMGSSGGI